MAEFLNKVWGQFMVFMGGLSTGKKVSFGLVGAVVVSGIAAVFMWAGQTSYKPLMTNLSAEDSTAIMRILREKRIPFRVDTTGRNIEVPPESVFDLRLELATQGYPASSSVGYEIFDKQSLGTTSFVQAINDKRAREGELMRTISAMKGVKRARVHLALPKKSAFVEDTKKATASVVLDLEPGTVLNDKQIYGVGHLISSAIEGLDVADVTILDSSGKVLSKSSRDSMVALTATQLDFKKELEDRYEHSIQQLLSPVVGEGRVIARVSAEVDFSQVTDTQTLYDADGSAVISVQKNNDSMQGSRPAPGGAPGSPTNLPGPDGEVQRQPAQVKQDTSRTREVVNYAVPQTIRKTTRPVGSVTKLSVAVVLDGKKVKTTDKEGRSLAKSEAWTPEQLKEFEKLVANAVALDPKRGDSLEVKGIEFAQTDFEDAENAVQAAERRAYVQSLLVYSVIGLSVALFFLFVVRPFVRWVTDNTTESVDSFLPQTIEELEKIQKNQALPGMEELVPELPEQIDPEKVEGEMIKEKIITLVDSNPHKASLILRDWIRANPAKTGADGANKTA